eukprot:TRINITY_DN14240_c0_g1_i12.p1 TRINITY_DN14240_c0_g1~~TRINITY_DN14240_c0_g1_i12.p1  ORF type:complete len:621 (-),score=50.02 TRINITY_DN14240_c0_g1_i12:323-2185(-)
MWSKVAKDACLKILETNVLVCAHTKKDEGSIGLGAAELYVDDNVLYVAGNKGLALFDISNPMASQRIGDIIDTGALSFHGGAMFVENSNLLYLAGGNGLRVLDTTDPKKPALLGSVIDTGIIADDAGLAGALVVASAQPLRRCLYIAGGKGLAVLDLTVPTVPSVIRTVRLSVVHQNCGVAMVLLETKNIMYIAGGSGLAIIDITVRTTPQVLGKIPETGAIGSHSGVAMQVKDNFLYVGGGRGLAVFDISDPKVPQRIAFEYPLCGCVAAEMLLEDKTLICLGGSGMRLFSLQQNGKPVPRGDVISTGVCSAGGGVGLLRTANTLCVGGGKGVCLFKYDMLLESVGSESLCGQAARGACRGLGTCGKAALDHAICLKAIACLSLAFGMLLGCGISFGLLITHAREACASWPRPASCELNNITDLGLRNRSRQINCVEHCTGGGTRSGSKGTCTMHCDTQEFKTRACSLGVTVTHNEYDHNEIRQEWLFNHSLEVPEAEGCGEALLQRRSVQDEYVFAFMGSATGCEDIESKLVAEPGQCWHQLDPPRIWFEDVQGPWRDDRSVAFESMKVWIVTGALSAIVWLSACSCPIKFNPIKTWYRERFASRATLKAKVHPADTE